jgi:hypothetical protein
LSIRRSCRRDEWMIGRRRKSRRDCQGKLRYLGSFWVIDKEGLVLSQILLDFGQRILVGLSFRSK